MDGKAPPPEKTIPSGDQAADPNPTAAVLVPSALAARRDPVDFTYKILVIDPPPLDDGVMDFAQRRSVGDMLVDHLAQRKIVEPVGHLNRSPRAAPALARS